MNQELAVGFQFSVESYIILCNLIESYLVLYLVLYILRRLYVDLYSLIFNLELGLGARV